MYENYGWKYVVTASICALWGLALALNDIPLGLDLSGGSEIIYTLDFAGRPRSVQATDDAVKILRERVDILGVKELSIRRQGNYEIVVQVPNATETEVERIKDQIEKAGRLQFRLLVTPTGSPGGTMSPLDMQTEIKRIEAQKANGSWQENDRYDIAYYHEQYTRGGGTAGAAALVENKTTGGKALYVDGDKLQTAYRTLDDRGKAAVGFEWNGEGAKLFKDLTGANKGRLLAIVLDGYIRSAPSIRSEIGKRGIIEGGDAGWDEKELTALIITLKAGALPAKPVFAYRKHVGASLGQAAVWVGGVATVVSLLVIMAFMCWYYGVRAGMVANIAMVMNIFLLLATLAMFDATLTLPGIAGILLTAAMAVDANILIYERIREEITRGAALRQAILAGYERAFWTIFDANLTTVLTALILMQVGTGPIKGFGLTLTIGIVVSMFTALFVTQALYGFFVAKGFIDKVEFKLLFEKINFDFWGAFPKAARASLAVICIGWIVFLLRGDQKYGIDFTGGTAIQMLLKQPIDKGKLEEELATHFKKKKLEIQVEVQRVGQASEGGKDEGREWLLRTRLVAGEAAKKVGAGPLDLLLPAAHAQDIAPAGSPSTPAVEAPAADDAKAQAKAAEAQKKDEERAKAAEEKARQDQQFFEAEIRELFASRLVDPYPSLEPTRGYVVEPVGDKAKGRFRVDLIGLPESFNTGARPVTLDRVKAEVPKALRGMAAALPDTDANRAQKDLLLALAGPEAGPPGFGVAPATSGTNQGDGTLFDLETPVVETGRVDRAVQALKQSLERARDHQVFISPAMPFPNIDQIGAVVAQNLKSKAILATILSVIMICLYIWLRFDFWAGITAVVALFHDVMALLGFLAILDTLLSAAGINFDCKFNLTTITAFLTLIGFSINDTIVILDRIREEMKLAKAKDYTPAIVNDAINKTLSRTVLTSTTVFMVVFVLFVGSFYGLTAIQGFSVALLFGVVVGTYSSIFVAAPLLLTDRTKTYKMLGGIVAFLLGTLILNGLR